MASIKDTANIPADIMQILEWARESNMMFVEKIKTGMEYIKNSNNTVYRKINVGKGKLEEIMSEHTTFSRYTMVLTTLIRKTIT